MCSCRGCSLRCFLIAFLLTCFALAVARQAFDFLGYQWLPILFNFLHILALVFVVFGVIQLRPLFLIGFLVWTPIWVAWNCFLVLYFLNVGSLDRDSHLLSFQTGTTANWWVGRTGCSMVYNRTLHRDVPGPCVLEFWHVELLQTFLQLAVTLVAIALVLVFLLNFSNHKLLRAATNTTMRVPYQPRVVLEPVEYEKTRLPPSLPTGYQSDTTGYLNASIDSSVRNGVIARPAPPLPSRAAPKYLPPQGSMERTHLEENGNAIFGGTEAGPPAIPNYRRPRMSSSSGQNNQKRQSGHGNSSDPRSSNSTESPSLPPNSTDQVLLPPGARPGYPASSFGFAPPPPIPTQSRVQRQSSQESEPEEVRNEPTTTMYERKRQRGSSLDNERRRRKDRRNSVPHHQRRKGSAPQRRSGTSEYAASNLGNYQPISSVDSHRLSSISAPVWDRSAPVFDRDSGARPPSASALSRDGANSIDPVVYGVYHQRHSARGFKNFPTANVARIAGVGNAVPVSDIDDSGFQYNKDHNNDHHEYQRYFDSAQIPLPVRSSSPVSSCTIPADEQLENSAQFPVTSFVSFDPESNTLIRYHDRNTPMSTFGGVHPPQNQHRGGSPPPYNDQQGGHFLDLTEDSPTIPTRYPPATPIVQETPNLAERARAHPHRPGVAPPPIPDSSSVRQRTARYSATSSGSVGRERVPSTQEQPDLDGSSLLV